MSTPVYGLPNGKASLDVPTHVEWNSLADTLEGVAVALGELLGPGVFLATDLNASIGAGLSVDISAGRAIVGDTGGRKVVVKTGATNVPSLTASATNSIFLNRDGTFSANTTGTPPANSIIVASCVTSGSAVTSVNNAPTGRQNLRTLLGLP